MIKEKQDLTLVQAPMLGKDQALTALMDRHGEGLYRFVLRLVRNEADALELATETFVRAYLEIGKFRPPPKFVSSLYHIASNLCRDRLRSRAYWDSLESASFDSCMQEGENPSWPAATKPGNDQKTERFEELNALEKAVSELPEDLGNAFILTALEAHPPAETAELLGISLKAVKIKVYRARKLLLKKMCKMGF